MTAIIVAICGAIIPLPLQMADSVTVLPWSLSVREASLMRVSVVRMASSGHLGSGRQGLHQLGQAARIFSRGSLTPMTPVEAISTPPSSPAPGRRPA